MTEAQKSERARRNWAILRWHVMEMRERANYFVIFLEEAKERGQESKNRDDGGNSNNNKNEVDEDLEEKVVKKWYHNFIINP